MKCQDCGQTREVVGRLEGRLMELDGKVQTAEKKMQNNHAEMKKIGGKLEGRLVGMNKRINEAIKNRHDEMKQEQHEVKKEIKDVKENLSKVNKDVDEVKVMMSQMLEKLNMLELLNKLPSPTRMFNTPREDTLIAGGLDAINSAEIFSWEKNGWYEISQMNDGQIGASSFIYNHQLFVVGGITNTIETLDLNELPLKWMEFSDKLPYESSDHQTVVYQQRVIHIGGYNCDEGKKSNVISELHRIESLFTHGELIRIYIYGTLTNYKILQTNKLQL
jgi:gas vesicle protein